MAKKTKRDDDLSGRDSIAERLLEIWTEVDKAFSDQWDRTNDQLDYWDIYNCVLNDKQCYSGNASAYVPIIHDAIMARATRFTNQLFPQSGRYVECVSENGDIPHAMISLMEHYIRKAKIRTNVVPPMCRSGDIEGQYSLYVSWGEGALTGIRKVDKFPTRDGAEVKDAKPERMPEKFDLHDMGPRVALIPDADLIILPVTVDTVPDAIAAGGSVTVIRRWTASEIEFARDEGWITEDAEEQLLSAMSIAGAEGQKPNIVQKHMDAAGIQSDGEFACVYETWAALDVDGDVQLCRAFYGGDSLILGCKLSPYWKPEPPILSCPREKMPGMIKGRSIVTHVAPLQYAANDFFNQGLDSGTFSMLPVIMTDPEKNPRVGTMVLDVAAVWETSPKDTSFAQFPPLYQHALQFIGALKSEVFQSLSVNSAMIPQQTGTQTNRKLNQAEIAQEQQVDILSTAEATSVIEEGILNDMLDWFLWLDHQFRDDAITVRAYGPAGMQMTMQKIEPVQMDHRFFFSWFGVQAARNAAQVQQQIAMMNVLRGIPPQQYQGYRLNLVPLINHLTESAFGPRLAPLIFESFEQQLTVEPDLENDMLSQGFPMEVHPLDDDQKHLQAHTESLQTEGDPHGTKRAHIQAHTEQIKMKAQAMAMQAMQAQQGGGAPGMPGGQGPGGQQPAPGVAGTPRIGAQPTSGRPQIYNPPGAIHSDRIGPSPGAMPRKMG